MKTIGISIIFIMAVFVFSCTPKDRTARINEIYEELEKEVADETKDESKTPDENLEPDDEQVEEDLEIIDESDEDAVEISDEDTGDTVDCSGNFPNRHKGLCWSDASSSGTTWDAAAIHCEKIGGRLPTISELRSLIQNCPATETGGACGATDSCLSYNECWNDNCNGCEHNESGKYSVFGDTGLLWSSSSDISTPDSAWGVYFGFGGIFNYGKTSSDRARCVRNGE